MARSSRLRVCLAMPTRNSSQIHWHRSTSRQRTTPSIAAVGPLSITAFQRRAMCLGQLRRLAGRLAGDQPIKTSGVELHHPIPNDLQCHSADRRRLGPPRPVIDGGQGQKTARLRRILRTPCNGAQARRIKISPQRDRHGEPPSFATLESDSRRSANPPASHALRDLVLDAKTEELSRKIQETNNLRQNQTEQLLKRDYR